MKSLIRLCALVALPLVASAHEGHGHGGVLLGVMHPLAGWDHLLAMVTVGFLGARLGGAARWQLPALFVTFLLGGALLGMGSGVALGGLEYLIAASLMALGLVTALGQPLALPWMAGLVALTATIHGFAHGVELPLNASANSYLIGMVMSSAMLHGLGLTAGLMSLATPRVVRSAGAAVAVLGLVLALAGG